MLKVLKSLRMWRKMLTFKCRKTERLTLAPALRIKCMRPPNSG